MLGMLIFISFILHAVTFYWIFSLKKRLSVASEMEDLLAVYLDDMKEQNDEWIRSVKTLQEPEKKENHSTVPESVVAVEKKKESVSPDYQPLDLPSHEDKGEFSVEGQVLSLHAQGLEYEEIAKKLGRGKGEVELLLRLAESKKKYS